jgi:hypothetical protein
MNTYNLISTITDLPKLVGCNDFPSSPQGMQLIKLINDFINEQYKYSGLQVKEAFTMAVKRELYLDGKRVDPSTFGQHLSVNVVGQVLTAYKESKRNDNARPKAYNSLQIGYNKKPITPKEAFELISKWCNEDGKLPKFAPYKIAFKHLLETGKVKDVDRVKSFGIKSRMKEVSDPETEASERWFTNNLIKI